jgi:hypothetical protein
MLTPLRGRLEFRSGEATRRRRSTPEAARRASLSHFDNGRLSTPWREVIFLSTVVDSIFDRSSPAVVYGSKLAFGWTIAGKEVRHADQRDNRRFVPRLRRKPTA